MNASLAKLQDRLGYGYLERSGEIGELDEIGFRRTIGTKGSLRRYTSTHRLDAFDLKYELSLWTVPHSFVPLKQFCMFNSKCESRRRVLRISKQASNELPQMAIAAESSRSA